jgi:hypothetical protein
MSRRPVMSEPYRPRRIECLEIWTPAGWRLKVYGIGYGAALPSQGWSWLTGDRASGSSQYVELRR